jgi:hypothetical protein
MMSLNQVVPGAHQGAAAVADEDRKEDRIL